MAENYNEIKKLVISHLHDLVDSVISDNRKKILVHEWVLGICKHWRDFAEINIEGSEFIPRVSFGIQGIRNRFERGMTMKEVINELLYVFEISTYCYFEYGARKDILNKIENYCKNADSLLENKILIHEFEKFKSSKQIIPLINKAIDYLNYFDENKNVNEFRINPETETVSELEKEFNKIIILITDYFITTMWNNMDEINEIKKELNQFTKEISELKYINLINKEKQKEINKIEDFRLIKDLTIDTISILKTPHHIKVNNEEISSKFLKFDKNKNLNKLTEEIISEISKSIINSLHENPLYFDEIKEKSDKIKIVWKEKTTTFFTDSQKKQISKTKIIKEEIMNIREENTMIKGYIRGWYESLKKINKEIMEPSRHVDLIKLYQEKDKKNNQKEIFDYLLDIMINLIKQNQEQEDKITKTIEKFLVDVKKKFNMFGLEEKYSNFLELAKIEVEVINFFNKPKKDTKVSLYDHSKLLVELKTNNKGLVTFDKIPRKEISIKVGNKKRKEKIIKVKRYNNKYKIRLFFYNK
ncbi:hypothetical protein HOA91_06065 [Candidatus Woesearchaeota archaeon]|nr:hypothetical protein [Candidatus Woesearchaeota archaeon]